MQIGGENIENIFENMVLEKKPLKKHRSKNTSFSAYLFRNGLKKFKFWNCPRNDIWNLKLSYLNQLQWIIFIRILILVYNMDIVFYVDEGHGQGKRGE